MLLLQNPLLDMYILLISNKSLATLSYKPQINDTFESHIEFVDKVKNYTRNCGFTIRLRKSKYYKKSENKESEKTIRKRTLLYSRASFAELKEYNSNNEKTSKKERNRVSQCCSCFFYIRASLNNLNNLWQIINMNLTHNHLMVEENHRFFMSNERNIPDDIKQRIELLCQASVDVPTIHAILKEKGSGLEKRELDAEEFVKILNQFKYDDAEFSYYVDINEDTKRLERAI
ncbi:1593_t:CDS:2 [Dentiscutata erythropus]|uniref:1593_t:CDS:1 n=1 Tax=Dentiscutata erythropus TaxID=1348616 RepID=A0A9N9IY72_9GLOM|nr:1593_t:CDS:2 [Dentiscutata erythropus]